MISLAAFVSCIGVLNCVRLEGFEWLFTHCFCGCAFVWVGPLTCPLCFTSPRSAVLAIIRIVILIEIVVVIAAVIC